MLTLFDVSHFRIVFVLFSLMWNYFNVSHHRNIAELITLDFAGNFFIRIWLRVTQMCFREWASNIAAIHKWNENVIQNLRSTLNAIWSKTLVIKRWIIEFCFIFFFYSNFLMTYYCPTFLIIPLSYSAHSRKCICVTLVWLCSCQ